MGYSTDGNLPKDAAGYVADGVYVPNLGTMAQQGVFAGQDTAGTNYGVQVVQLASGSVTSLTGTGLAGSLPAIVQKAHSVSTSGVAALTCAFASNNTAGNSIVVVCGVGDGTAATVTDSNSNTYTKAVNAANSTTFSAQIFYAVNVIGGANTVTVTPDSSISVGIQIYEVSGLIAQANNVLDQSSAGTGTSATASASNIASISPNVLAFMGVSVGTAAQAVSATTGTNWTLDSTQNVAGTPSGLFTFGALSQALGAGGPVAAKATLASSEPYAVAVATFRPVLLGVQGTVFIGGYNYTRVTTAATTLVKNGPGILHSVCVNTLGASATIELDDAITNTTPIIGKIALPATITAITGFVLDYDVQFNTGLSVTVATATVDATIIWK